MKRHSLSLLVFIAYAVAACIVTYPAITALSTHLIGHPFGDSTEYAAHIAWIAQALHQGINPFFQANLLYPQGLTAAWLWAVPLQSFPAALIVYAAPGAIALAFNLSILLALTLNGWSMFALMRAILTDGRFRVLAAFLAGLIYLTYPTFGGHLAAGHLGLISLWGVPLFALFLIRSQRTQRKNVILAGVFFAVSALGSTPLIFYLTLPIALIILWQSRRSRAALIRQIGAIVIGGAILLIFVTPYAIESMQQESVTPARGIIQYGASALAIVSPSPLNPLYRGLGYPGQVIGGEPFETTGYIGIVALIFSTIGVIAARQSRVWMLAAAIAWVLSLGAFLRLFDQPIVLTLEGYPTRIALPYLLIHDLPGLSLIRTPARFNFAIGFAVAVMAGYGAAWMLPKFKRFAVPVLLIACAAVLIDTRVFWEMPLIDGRIPDAIAALRDSGARAVFDVPYDHPLVDKEGLYLQSAHGLPMIGGHIARETPLDPAKGTLLQNTLDPALLDQAGVDVIVLHRQWDDAQGELEQRLIARFGAPRDQDEQFAVFIVPDYEGESAGALWHVNETENGGARVSVYVPEAAQALLSGRLDAGSARGATVSLNGVPMITWAIAGVTDESIALGIPAGYSTIEIAPDPACEVPPAPLMCRIFHLHDLTMEFTP